MIHSKGSKGRNFCDGLLVNLHYLTVDNRVFGGMAHTELLCSSAQRWFLK